MLGAIFSIIAGALIGVQGVFNARAGDKLGLWETSTFIHATGFIFALILTLLFGNGSFKKIGEVNKFYLTGGLFGVIIVFSVIQGINLLGAAYSVTILLVAQLIVATIIDSFGLFGSPRIPFDLTKAMGLGVMVLGILIFKSRG
jgi:bacterial/archaeal transporter family-2 protein